MVHIGPEDVGRPCVPRLVSMAAAAAVRDNDFLYLFAGIGLITMHVRRCSMDFNLDNTSATPVLRAYVRTCGRACVRIGTSSSSRWGRGTPTSATRSTRPIAPTSTTTKSSLQATRRATVTAARQTATVATTCLAAFTSGTTRAQRCVHHTLHILLFLCEENDHSKQAHASRSLRVYTPPFLTTKCERAREAERR